MQATGRTPVLSENQRKEVRSTKQTSEDNKRDTRRSLMCVVAHETDVLVKRAPVSKKGELPHTRWEYHEKIVSGRRKEE